MPSGLVCRSFLFWFLLLPHMHACMNANAPAQFDPMAKILPCWEHSHRKFTPYNLKHQKCTTRRLQHVTKKKYMRGRTTSKHTQGQRRHAAMHHLESTGLRHMININLPLQRTLCPLAQGRGLPTISARKRTERGRRCV